MDADDVMLPDRLERQVAHLDAHPDVALLGGGIVLVDESGTEIDREPGRPQLDFLVRNELTHATVMMRTEAFHELGGYRLDQSEDYDLWLRFDERYGVAALAEPVIRYRLHPGQFSVTALERQALGFLCVREAAIRRRRGEPDPLIGVDAAGRGCPRAPRRAPTGAGRTDRLGRRALGGDADTSGEGRGGGRAARRRRGRRRGALAQASSHGGLAG